MKAIQYKNLKTVNGKGQVRILKVEDYDRWFDCDDYEAIQLPCGQCTGCRMDYARQWANRLMLELEHYKNDHFETKTFYRTVKHADGSLEVKEKEKTFRYDPSCCHFITLTFDADAIESIGDEDGTFRGQPYPHVRRPFRVSDNGVVYAWSHSLCKRDLQLFLKRLRKQHPDDEIRFFACGEYGDESVRPHYHLIVFGLHLDTDDLTFYKKSNLGYNYMNSKSIAKIWPYGYNVVAPVTWESCCYVSRYMLKKIKGTGAELYDYFNIEEPFTTMSRRPGISSFYYETHEMDENTVSFVVGTDKGSRRFPPPRYLEKLFEMDNPEAGRVRRQIRRLSAINSQNLVLRRTNKTAEQYLADQEEKFMKSVKVLEQYRHNIQMA